MKVTTSSAASAAMLFIASLLLPLTTLNVVATPILSSPSSSDIETITTTTTTTTTLSAQSSSSASHQSKKTKALLLPRKNPFSSKQSPPVMPIAPPHIHNLITCYLTRPGHTLWTNPAMIRKVYGKLWKHGGEFEAPPGEIRQVMCRKTGGVFVLNTTDEVMYISYADIGGMTRDAMEACDNHFGQTNGEMKDQDGKGYIVIVSHTDKC